ncbi:PREDICTED: uncharacterized protein LOC109333964 [Lupinus angustifolius]|uniref:uncharacterized protein LOC109333964 n=1 Tax=Lupinus angustifolius TaxID=3871 RepID=UPI00092FA860|nr:PREDICTED: uncharacterized protein LOC109333964 [Lupinus angustifolius]
MKAEFEISDLGNLSYFIGIEFSRTKAGILINQKKYASDVLKRFQLEDCNSVSTPSEVGNKIDALEGDKVVDKTFYRQMIGCLRYVYNTRLDIAYGIGVVSRHMESPKKSDLLAAKRLLRYVNGTIDFGLVLPNKLCILNQTMLEFSDVEW